VVGGKTGDFVGFGVGPDEGKLVGFGVGPDEGKLVGRGVGKKDGAVVVGDGVGFGVGDKVDRADTEATALAVGVTTSKMSAVVGTVKMSSGLDAIASSWESPGSRGIAVSTSSISDHNKNSTISFSFWP